MKVLNSEQMRKIDKKTIEEIGIIGPILMENAGLQIHNALIQQFPEPQKERIVIIAGKGNNGGDGFVVARHLFNQGCSLKVLLLGSKKELKGDAALNCGIAERIGIDIFEISSTRTWDSYKKHVKQSTLLIDAIFGTGLTKPAAGLYSKVIDEINKAKAFKIAVDIPSGLSSDTFQIIGPCVKANLTVTLAAPKIAHLLPPAEDYIGKLVTADISIPPYLFEDKDLKLELVEKKTLLKYFQKRN